MAATPPIMAAMAVPLGAEALPHASLTGAAARPLLGHDVRIEVVRASSFGGVSAAWRDLVGRAAEPNVFMEPAFVQAAAQASAANDVCVMLAWDAAAGRSSDTTLLGAWAFIITRNFSRPIHVLQAPAHDLAFLATPVIDARCVEAVLTAMLDAVAVHGSLPKLIMLTDITTEGPIMTGLRRVLHGRGVAPAFLKKAQRPVLRPAQAQDHGEPRSSSGTLKKLRQHRRRLATMNGPVALVSHAGPEDVRAALEEFLFLEASGWKGRRGTALLSDKHTAAFTREFVNALARDGLATIEALRAGDRPVAMQVLLRSGASAFTWKVTYDEALGDVSPGVLLLQDLTAALMADSRLTLVDSCTYNDESYMAGVWKDREGIADMLIDVRRGGSLSFTAAAGFERAYRGMRETAKAAYIRLRRIRRPLMSRLRGILPRS
jgi:CelD/BcsL family acetyltransferase involved in cellulose biosynthesis